LKSIDPRARLTWIDARLARTARQAQIWKWGWSAGIVVTTAGNLVPLAFVPRDERIDWYTGAATTIVGLVPLLIAPLDVIADARATRVDLTRLEGSETVCATLARAEARLVHDAANQADGQRWWLHAGNVVLNVGVGLFLGLGYGHWKVGAFNAAVGAAIGEAILLTQPTGSIDDARAYRAADLGPPTKLSLGYTSFF
jgi:hypothetical protein